MIFFFLLVVWLYSKEELRRRRGERKKIILYIHQNFNDDIINIVGKISTKRVKQHKKKSHMMSGVSHTNSPKMLGLTCLMSRSCDSFQLLLVTFHNIVGFVSSKSFQRYWKYYHQSFNPICIRCLFLSFFCFFSLYPLYPLSNLLIKSCVDTYNQ